MSTTIDLHVIPQWAASHPSLSYISTTIDLHVIPHWVPSHPSQSYISVTISHRPTCHPSLSWVSSFTALHLIPYWTTSHLQLLHHIPYWATSRPPPTYPSLNYISSHLAAYYLTDHASVDFLQSPVYMCTVYDWTEGWKYSETYSPDAHLWIILW